MTTLYHCGCGKWAGEPCEWRGPLSEMVVVEYMPECLRASHLAAGNAGIHPHNGSIRVAVERSCAGMLLADDEEAEWSRVVDDDDPGKYADCSDEPARAVVPSPRCEAHYNEVEPCLLDAGHPGAHASPWGKF